MRCLGFQHVTGEFLLTTGTIVLIFISLFLAVAQERSQFIDRLALQPARIQIPAYVCAFLALELFPATGRCRLFIFSFEQRVSARRLQTVELQMRVEKPQRVKSKIESKFENDGPDWARTSDPALIKRML